MKNDLNFKEKFKISKKSLHFQRKVLNFEEKFELLKTLATARLYGIKSFKKGLSYILLNYPNSKEGQEAEKILKDVIPTMENPNFTNLSEGSSFKTIFPFSSSDSNLIHDFKSYLGKFIDKETILELTLSEDIPKTFNLPLAVSLVPEAKRTNTPGSIVKLSPDGIVISQSTW